MKEVRISENEGKVVYKLFKSADCERVNPIEHDHTRFFSMNISILREALILQNPGMNEDFINQYVIDRARSAWEEEYKKSTEMDLPENLTGLFVADSKKDQLKLLEGSTITSLALRKFLYVGWLDYGFCYSQYTSEHDHKNFNKQDLPSLSYIDANGINKVGKTPLSDGQLKHAIEYRKVTISKFLDKGDQWHCFFITYDSIKGKERWKNGQSHYHYISSLFGMSREKVLNELKSKTYNLGSLPHIPLTDYGNQS